MQIQVYLNTTAEGFAGFHNEFSAPAVRLATRFTLKDPAVAQLQDGVPVAVLEKVFEQLNVGGDLVPAEEWTVAYRAAGNRSLSVGDVVVVGESAFACASVGWEPLPGGELRRAIDANTGGGRGYQA